MRDSEPAALRSWRIACFVELGYSPELAIELDRDGFDLHALANLISKGCPLLLARRILIPY